MNKTTRRRRRQTAPRRRGFKAVLVALSCMMLVAMISIGGTMAWLMATSEEVSNTFTAGDINITLTETTTNFKMVPGNKIAKDPKVTVQAGSEACWLFVEVTKENNYDDYFVKRDATNENQIAYTDGYPIAAGWRRLQENVYYREVDAVASTETNGRSFYVLGPDEDTTTATYDNGHVLVQDTVTKSMMEAAKNNGPKLIFKAYAVQKDNVTSASAAWAIAKPTNSGSGS